MSFFSNFCRSSIFYITGTQFQAVLVYLTTSYPTVSLDIHLFVENNRAIKRFILQTQQQMYTSSAGSTIPIIGLQQIDLRLRTCHRLATITFFREKAVSRIKRIQAIVRVLWHVSLHENILTNLLWGIYFAGLITRIINPWRFFIVNWWTKLPIFFIWRICHFIFLKE